VGAQTLVRTMRSDNEVRTMKSDLRKSEKKKGKKEPRSKITPRKRTKSEEPSLVRRTPVARGGSGAPLATRPRLRRKL